MSETNLGTGLAIGTYTHGSMSHARTCGDSIRELNIQGSEEAASCITQLWVALKFRILIEPQSHLPKRTPSIILSPHIHVSTSLCLFLLTEMIPKANGKGS